MAGAAESTSFSRTDRMGVTVFGSVLTHLVVILGVSFAFPEARSNVEPLPSLEITLVNTRTSRAPEEADYLAQANQDGGGEHDRAAAQSPLPVTFLPDLSLEVMLAAAIDTRSRTELMDYLSVVRETGPTAPDASEPLPEAADEVGRGLAPVASRGLERARLSAEISEFWEQYHRRPRRKFVSARTREYRFAKYMEAWRSKVERIGNLNYPEAARRDRLTGSLILDVALNRDGSVADVAVQRSSSHKALDDAAVRIVRLAAPFAPFPEEFRGDIDVLHITRTWEFLAGNRLASR